MELLEKDDPLKSQLLMKSAQHREELEQDMKMISERTQKILTNALIIGGALAATYLVVPTFSGSKKKSKGRTKKIKFVNASNDNREDEVVEASSPGIVSQIGTALASQATVFLLSIAKDKLTDFIKGQFDKKEEAK